jgi:transforming growth factor-beta-induced protein
MDPKKLVLVLLLFALVGVSYAGAAQTTTGATSTQDIVQIVQANPNLSTLATALDSADLERTLSGEGPFTLFAPTNTAFDALPPGSLNALLANKTALTSVLTYHVVPGSYLSTRIASMTSLPTVQGMPLPVTIQPQGGIRVDGANVIQADIPASNGVIHIVDTVMLPSTATVAPTLTPTLTRTPILPTTTAAGFDAVLVSACALAGIALLIGVRRRF